tara:strand:+ start:564 stop:797 length:234 start_codon:yes stop_codon:yes gene_type:complete
MKDLRELKIAILDHGYWILGKPPVGKISPMRVTVKDWKAILLEYSDTMIWEGRMYDIIGKSIGFGVVELSYIARQYS